MTIDKIVKRGFAIPFSWELLLSGPHQRRGHKENIQPPTAEEWFRYHEATRMWAALQENPYLRITGYDWDWEIEEPEPTYDWVWDETEDEWKQRIGWND